ncbi:VWA domain-containing protein [Candidatus Poribacteria bacterium]|nr:VWA domain-containing protein [Candidatus Poribacteria bacterium]
MRFERPVLLFAVLALPVIAAWLLGNERRRIRDCHALSRFDGSLAASVPTRRALAILLLGALLLLAVAAAGPGSRRTVASSRNDRDIAIVLDSSLSMAAEDIRPSRLAFARTMARTIVEHLNGERVSMTAVAGRGVVQCPLTRDYDAVVRLIDSVATDMIPQPGSAIADGLSRALGSFGRERQRDRVMLLLTDGEEHEPGAVRIARQVGRAGVPIWVIGVGTEEGSPIALRGESGTITGYKRDKDGTIVTTRLNPTLLRHVAEASDGALYLASPDGHVLTPVIDRLREIAPTGASPRRWLELTLALAAAALAWFASLDVLPPFHIPTWLRWLSRPRSPADARR